VAADTSFTIQPAVYNYILFVVGKNKRRKRSKRERKKLKKIKK
jgi:hypothetical protein